MYYQILRWTGSSGSLLHSGEFDNDDAVRDYILTLDQSHTYTAESVENGAYRQVTLNDPLSNSSSPVAVSNGGYRIYEYVKSDKIPGGNKNAPPDDLDYFGIYLTRRLQSKFWLHHGLVVQCIHYAEYNQDSGIFSIPVVKEKWIWELDPETNFCSRRDIEIQWYASNNDSDTGTPVLLPHTKTLTKYYPSDDSRIEEIQRRRKNVISELSKNVITFIVITKTLPEVAINPFSPSQQEFTLAKKRAIKIGSDFMDSVAIDIENFKNQGSDSLAVRVSSTQTLSDHPWLSNDLMYAGLPGVTIRDYIISEITTNVRQALLSFDYNALPAY